MPNYLGEKKISVEDKERFMEDGDKPKSRERILWKSAKIGGKEGRLSSSFKGLKLPKISRGFQGEAKTKTAETIKGRKEEINARLFQDNC